MAIVGHASESAIGDGLKVSVAAEGRIMLVNFFVAVTLAPNLI